MFMLENNMKIGIRRTGITQLVLTSLCMALCSVKLCAQHYPAGSEGIKGATMPPPGLYFEDYNSFYFYDKVQGFPAQGRSGPEQFSYTQTPRLTWITPWHILDTDFGAAVRIPFVERLYTHSVPYGPPISTTPFPTYNYKTVTDSQFGLSDIQVEPLILAWHLRRFDFVASYSLWIPTGDWNHNNYIFDNFGQGYWTHSIEFGATWYLDNKKTWAVSILNHYDINTAQYSGLYYEPTPSGVASLDTTLGDIYTLEWAVSKTIVKGIDVGVTGYYQQQVTDTEGPTFNGPTWKKEKIHVAGIGPEIRGTYAKWGLSGSLRYAYEFSAMDHPQGNLITLTITKSF
jgi:hypothetical protein